MGAYLPGHAPDRGSRRHCEKKHTLKNRRAGKGNFYGRLQRHRISTKEIELEKGSGAEEISILRNEKHSQGFSDIHSSGT